jgi:hypothetical protein
MYKLLSLLFLWVPAICFGVVSIGDYTLVKNEIWNKQEYIIGGSLVIPKGVTLKIQTQSLNVQSGSIYVYGTLEILGNTNIQFSNSSQGIFVIGGSLLISDSKVTNCPKVMVWNVGTAIFSRNEFSDCIGSTTLISAWGKSNLSVSDTIFKRNTVTTVIESYGSSSVSIDNSQFENIQAGRVVQVYGQGAFLQVQNSLFKNLGSTNGVEVFDMAVAYVDKTNFSNVNSAIQSYGESEMVITGSVFEGNKIGVEMYNASTTISENSFEEHSEYAIYASGGNIDARNNWWADQTGPKYVLKNLTGKGESLDGLMDVYPWLVEKPNTEKCCSSVVFFPGIQGSRLYTRGYLFENQLWEPNRDKDVQKLFFNSSGEPVSKSIYTKDIIDRTNIGSSLGVGTIDTDVYKGFVDFTNSLQKKKSINGYQVFPYDWRYSSWEILELNKESWKKKVYELAQKSKTKKVTVVGHSFGGIVATQFVTFLEEQGLGNLVDDVVIVGAPEHGSYSVVQALLHGDGLSLGKGFILSQTTARSLSKNIGSTYELLSKTMNADWFKDAIDMYPKAGRSIFNVYSSIGTVTQFSDFIFKKNEFSTRSTSESDIAVPLTANEFVFNKVKESVMPHIPTSVKVFNIIGSNQLTPIGTEYRHVCSREYGLFFLTGLKIVDRLFSGEYCAVERKTKFTDKGDGIVPLGNVSQRMGSKIFVDFKKYMNLHEEYISHANMMSSEPVLSLLKEILFKRKLSFASAAYITLPEDELHTEEVAKYWRVRVLGKGKIHIETSEGNLDDTLIREGYVESNKIAGATYEVIDGNRYVLLPVEPNKVEITSDDFGYANVTVDTIDKNNASYTTSLNQPVYFYPTIPVSPKTVVTIATSSMFVDFDGDTINDEEHVAYIATTTESEIQKTYTIDEIVIELNFLKEKIAKSSIRQKFKDRYILKVDATLRKIKKYDSKNPKQYSSVIYTSLESIIKEIQTGFKNYKGGLKIEEASVLHVGFGKIFLMFLNLRQ